MGPKMEPALIAVRGEPLVGHRRGRVGRLGEKEKSSLARGPGVSAREGARAYASVKPVIPLRLNSRQDAAVSVGLVLRRKMTLDLDLSKFEVWSVAVPAEVFFLPPPTAGTLQGRIRGMVVKGILAGRLRPGDKMPSSRGLAVHLGVSRKR